MKKLLLLPALVIFATASIAQPTLSDVFPSADEVFTLYSVDAFVPGTTGADAIWDYSGFSSADTRTFTYLEPADTPYGADFPTATIALEESGNYEYLNFMGGIGDRVGVAGPPVQIYYSDPATYLTTNLDFNQNTIDDFEATFNSGGIDFTRTGTVDIKYAGYGSLLLPTASLNNVILFEVIEDYSDAYVFMGTPLSIDYYAVTYIWYKSGIHIPVLSTTTGTVDGGQGFESGFYADIVTVSNEEAISEINAFELFPNPASDFITIQFELLSQNDVSVSILDMAGREKLQVIREELQQGSYGQQVDLTALPSGMYIAKVQLGNQVEAKMFVKE